MVVSTVIKFPKTPIQRAPDIDETNLIETIRQSRQNYVDITALDIYNNIANQLLLSGFMLNHVNDARDILLICESLRAAMLRKYGIEHPLHRVSDNMKIDESLITDEDDDTDFSTDTIP